MRSGVDSPRKPRHDRVALAPDLAGEHARHPDTGSGSIARADDGNGRHVADGSVSLRRNNRRRQVHATQHRRIVGFADGNESGPATLRRLQFGFRLALGRNAGLPLRAAARCKFRQHGDGGLGRSEAVDEVAERGRPDILGANQAKPVEPLPVGKPGASRRRVVHPLAPIFDSVPASRREMLARCFMKTRTLIAATAAA